MDLNRAVMFCRVVEQRSFTAAARSLGVPKSSVSRGVAQLEAELGVELLRRSTRKLALTEAGQLYFERLSRVLSDLEQANAAVADLQHSDQGVVRMTAPVELGSWLLGEVVARFVSRYPRIHVDVRLTSQYLDLVQENIDLALRAGDLNDSTLIRRRLGNNHAGLFASPKYLERRGSPRRLAELARHEAIVFRAIGPRWRLRGPTGVETVEVSGPVTTDNFNLVAQLAVEGVGIAVLPTFLSAQDVARGQLVRVLPQWQYAGPGGKSGGGLQLVYPAGRYVPRRAVLFREFLLAELAQLAPDAFGPAS